MQEKFLQNVYGIPVYQVLYQRDGGRVLSYGYRVGNSRARIKRWKGVIESAKRQAGKK